MNSSAKTSDWIGRMSGVISAFNDSLPAIASANTVKGLLNTFTLTFPQLAASLKIETREEHYRKLRRDIVASGAPLLGDDELRAEIESRKGDREL